MSNELNLEAIKKNKIGISLMLVACFMLSLNSVIINNFTSHIKATSLFFTNNLVSFFLVSIYVIIFKKTIPSTRGIKIYFARGFLLGVGMPLWYFSLIKIPVTEATSLSYITPLLNVFGAAYFLKEKLNFGSVIALFVGLTGVLVILRPGFQEISVGIFSCILAALFWAAADLLAKKQAGEFDFTAQIFYTFLATLIFSIGLFIWQYEIIHVEDFAVLLIVSIIQLANVIVVLKAYQYADLRVIIPFDFSRIIFAAILAYFVDGEIISLYTIMGSIFICLSAIYVGQNAVKETVKSKIN